MLFLIRFTKALRRGEIGETIKLKLS